MAVKRAWIELKRACLPAGQAGIDLKHPWIEVKGALNDLKHPWIKVKRALTGAEKGFIADNEGIRKHDGAKKSVENSKDSREAVLNEKVVAIR